MTFKPRGTHSGYLGVGWRNSSAARVACAGQGIAIERSAANRFVVFGAAHALKNHELS